MRPAKIVAIVIGVLLILVSLGFLGSGGFLTWVGGHTDSDGFLSLAQNHLSTDGYALASPGLEVNLGSNGWLPGNGLVELRATSSGSSPLRIWEPSSGGIGIRLKKASVKLTRTMITSITSICTMVSFRRS